MLDPKLQEIMTYKTLHALCSVNKKDEMRVVYYVSCLVYGNNPVWGVWNVNCKFLHFAAGREAIARIHPNLTWRRIMTRWSLMDDEHMPPRERRKFLEAQFNKPLPSSFKKPAVKAEQAVVLQ